MVESLNIRPKNYVRVPVHFKPDVGNTLCEGVVTLSLENELLTKVKLIGKSNFSFYHNVFCVISNENY